MKRGCIRSLVIVAIAAFCATTTQPLRADPHEDGTWSSILPWGAAGGVEAIHTFMLPTGKVLFWQRHITTVGLWDPVTGLFSAAGNAPSHNPFCSGSVWLPDGRLLVAGGHDNNDYVGEWRADIYNPFTNLWANADPNQPNVPDMGPNIANVATSGKRWYPSATSLGNGDVLVMSGDVTQVSNTNRQVQIYEHETNTWRTLTGAIRPTNDILPEYPRVFLAPDGRAVSLADFSNDTELLDMSGNGSWSYLQDTLHVGTYFYGSAVMYEPGKIVNFGGHDTPPSRHITMLDLNAENPAWRYAGGGTVAPSAGSPYAMAQGRRQHNATIMADGKVLITGGTSNSGWNDPSGRIVIPEVWDPVTETVTQLASASGLYRGYHSTGMLLPDGRILVTGGDHDGGINLNAEIYTPSYLFAEDGSPAVRPTIAGAPSVAELGDTIFVETPDAESIAMAHWIVPGAVTHAQNWTQRRNNLDFTVVDGGLNITLPSNENEAPIGYYMLFLVNQDGTPSLASWVQATLNISLPGDFNGDDFVDAADYTVWRDALGTTYTEADYDVWKTHFGDTAGSGSVSEGAAVPETSTFVLMLGLAAGVVCRTSRSWSALLRM